MDVKFKLKQDNDWEAKYIDAGQSKRTDDADISSSLKTNLQAIYDTAKTDLELDVFIGLSFLHCDGTCIGILNYRNASGEHQQYRFTDSLTITSGEESSIKDNSVNI